MQGWTGRLEGATFCGTRGDAVAAGVDRVTSNREELSNVYENACALFHHGRGGGLGRGRHGRCGRRDAEGVAPMAGRQGRSEEHTSELQSLMRISYAVFCLKKKKT